MQQYPLFQHKSPFTDTERRHLEKSLETLNFRLMLLEKLLIFSKNKYAKKTESITRELARTRWELSKMGEENKILLGLIMKGLFYLTKTSFKNYKENNDIDLSNLLTPNSIFKNLEFSNGSHTTSVTRFVLERSASTHSSSCNQYDCYDDNKSDTYSNPCPSGFSDINISMASLQMNTDTEIPAGKRRREKFVTKCMSSISFRVRKSGKYVVTRREPRSSELDNNLDSNSKHTLLLILNKIFKKFKEK
ncbi:unnamed protein product [Gordionus sp. m RMFG-2023]|uniref:uncharacterized protein LOC135926433 n=1 Tax=Gordionus sp. m RMFG-2023 TaxID=3053472 RepID=UPI0030E31C17